MTLKFKFKVTVDAFEPSYMMLFTDVHTVVAKSDVWWRNLVFMSLQVPSNTFDLLQNMLTQCFMIIFESIFLGLASLFAITVFRPKAIDETNTKY